MKRSKIFFTILFSISLVFLIMRPILGNVWYPMHDSTHIARLSLLEDTLKSGRLPFIWAEGINDGYGYPLFHFYAPLFYYVALAFKLISGTFILALKLSLGVFLLLGALGVGNLTKRFGVGAMLLGVTLFLTSPYLAVDLYVRGAFAELASLCLLPWVFYVWQDLTLSRQKVTAAVITTLFVLSHNLIPVIAFPIVLAYVIVLHFRRLSVLVVPTVLTVLLSAFFLLPLVFERNFVQADVVAKTSDYTSHFVSTWQIWNSTWGFGGSSIGVEDGFSFKLGKLHLVLAVLGFVVLVIKKHTFAILGAFCLYALFMTTSISSPLWDLIPILPLTQFPWRHLALAVSLLAILGSSFTITFTNNWVRRGFVGVAITLLLVLNLKYFVPQSIFPADDSRFTSSEYLATVPSIIPEYMPRWMPVSLEPTSQDFVVKDTTIEFSKAYYPTWRVLVDNKVVPTHSSETGLLVAEYSGYFKIVDYYQFPTNLEIFAYFLSLLGLSSCIYLWRKK